MNHLLNNYATINSAVDTLCSAMAEKGYPNYIPTADTLWSVYSLVSAVNNGSVPYNSIPNSADFCKGNAFQYGVKAEKAKHRKSRKSKRLEGTYHQGKYSSNAWGWKKCNQRDLSLIAEKEKVRFKQNHLLILEDAYSDYMETYFGDTENDDYGFDDYGYDDWEEPDENNIIVGDNWKKYAHCD